MKNWIKKTAGLLAITFVAFSLHAQMPPEPNGGNNPTDPGSGNNPVGGGASIGGGIAILLALGAGYGSKKVYDFRKRKIAE